MADTTTVWRNLELDADIAQWGPALEGDITDALIAEFAPHNKTGDTAASLETHWTGEGFEVTGSKVAIYIETGTRPHPIDAKGPYSLHNPETDEYFGPHVNHPGTTADPFIERAFDTHGDEWIDALWQRIAADWEET